MYINMMNTVETSYERYEKELHLLLYTSILLWYVIYIMKLKVY